MAPFEIRNQFVGVPMKVLLSEGETLYRFLEARFNGPPSDLWLPLETYHHLRRAPSIPEWAVWKNANARPQVAAATFCRATLLKKAYAFRGCVHLPGNHVTRGHGTSKTAFTLEDLVKRSMLWIPGLSGDDFLLRSYWLGNPPPGWRPG
jgi:hypothetical protein